jgi:hypothetical protein
MATKKRKPKGVLVAKDVVPVINPGNSLFYVNGRDLYKSLMNRKGGKKGRTFCRKKKKK